MIIATLAVAISILSEIALVSMNRSVLLDRLSKVESLAQASKWRRLMSRPIRYTYAILFRELWYRNSKVERSVSTGTFYGQKMKIYLPSSTDIYLTGGKSHSSEIRLARFLIEYLDAEQVFFDIGAHYGYFTNLAALLVGDKGKVFAFEPSPKTFQMLSQNTGDKANIYALNLAVSNSDKDLLFYEFPNLYSEYNSINNEQYKSREWYEKYQPKEIKVKAVTIDDFAQGKNVIPNIVKIDVEGAELQVLEGMREVLRQSTPIVVMEYLLDRDDNSAHVAAASYLKDLGYYPNVINNNGRITRIDSIAKYMESNKSDSDNIVFAKEELL